MLVLEASSSMGESTGKTTKMKLARDVAHELVSRWDSRLKLGIAAYGHRRGRSCSDLSVVAPVRPLDGKALGAAIDRLKPTGQAPLVSAIQFAADQLDYSRRKATLVLISDGVENCGGDPCAAAEDMKRIGFDFRVHVVGVGDNAAVEARQLACVAEKTGGEYHIAKDGIELKQLLGSLVRRVEEQSGLARKSEDKDVPVNSPPVEATWTGPVLRQLQETAPGSLQLRAIRTRGGNPVRSAWRIASADKSRQLGQAEETSASFPLAPGQYVLRASSVEHPGNVQIESPIEVRAGKNPIWELVYNSGIVTFSSVEFVDGPLIDTEFRIRRQGSGTIVASMDRAQQPSFELLPGKYQVAVEIGNALVRRDFEIKAGDNGTQIVAMNIGTIALRAVTDRSGGSPVTDAHWHVFSIRAKGATGASAASREYQSDAEFTLAQGDYLAKVDTDSGKSGQVRFSVKAGERHTAELIVK